jgi:hypothetical protein
MVPFNKEDTILSAWLVSQPGIRDWFAVIRKRKDKDKFQADTQVQYYQHNEYGPAGYIGGEGGIVKATDDKSLIIEQINEAAHGLKDSGFGNKLTYYEIDDGLEMFYQLIEHYYPELKKLNFPKFNFISKFNKH